MMKWLEIGKGVGLKITCKLHSVDVCSHSQFYSLIIFYIGLILMVWLYARLIAMLSWHTIDQFKLGNSCNRCQQQQLKFKPFNWVNKGEKSDVLKGEMLLRQTLQLFYIY